jgi:flagellar capping protein FliD
MGSINGHTAKGVGNQLTVNSNSAETGLTIAVDSTQTGGFGLVTISSGIADKLPASLASYTDAARGVLKSKGDSLQASVDTITSQIQRMEDRFTKEEQDLRDRFARLEKLLQQYNKTGQFLAMQLGSLMNNGSSMNLTTTSNGNSSV